GRVFCGTIGLGIGLGRLYRLDQDGSIRVVLDGIGCSNGIAWTTDLSQMYYTDSSAGTIWLFDYDRPTGEITNQRVFKKFGESEGGAPDGLTVDAEGNVWSAVWGGGCVICFAPDGSEVNRIITTSPATTCPTFGGPELKELYITSSRHAEKSPEDAGALYHARPGATGRPEFLSRVRFSK
ncbi:MAG: SMP-30/gluconolactonase/LRE family protein, partial [Fimbriimonas sp.]